MTVKEYFKETCNYDLISTFWEDFSIAERFGASAIKDTYKRAFEGWKSDYKMITELVLILNHKLWYFYNHKLLQLASLYNDLWKECDAWCCKNLKGKELEYFYNTLD